MLWHREAQNTQHGTKKRLWEIHAGCLNSMVCLEILQFLMYLLTETWLS